MADESKRAGAGQAGDVRWGAWTKSISRWLDMERWDLAGAAPATLEQFGRRPCYVGLDLSTTTDLTTGGG